MKRIPYRTATIAAIACLALVACDGPSEGDEMAAARAALQKGDHKTAAVHLKTLLQKNSQSGEARYLLGKAQLAAGDATAAAVELGKAADLRYDDKLVIPALAQALLRQNQNKKLTDVYGRYTLQGAQARADLNTSLATAYFQQGQRERGEEALATVLQAAPQYAPALLVRARQQLLARDVAAARATVDGVLARDPKDAAAWQMRGDIEWLGGGSTDASLAAYREALAIDPAMVAAHNAIISLLIGRQDFTGAGSQLETLKKLLPTHPQTVYLEAQLAFVRQDFKRARELTLKLLRIAPSNVGLLQLAGAIEFQSNSLSQAEAYLQKALQELPELTFARRVLAETYMRGGQPSKALAALQPALARAPVEAGMLSLAAEAYLQNGDLKQAESLFAQAARSDPTDPKARTALALIRLAKGDAAVAFSELEAIAASDSSASADLALISARLRRNDSDGAMKAIAGLERKQPDKPLPLLLRGRVQVTRGEIPAARASFERALAIDPVYLPAAASLGSLDVVDKKPELAKKRIDEILRLDPKHFEARMALADLKARTGAPNAEVIADITAAIKLNPSEPRPRLLIIGHYLQHKNFDAALVAAQDAAAALPNDMEILDVLGRAQSLTGDNQQAISSFSKLAAGMPQSPLPHLRLADLFFSMRKAPQALQSLKRALEIDPDNLVAQRALMRLAVESNKPDEAIQIARTVQRQRPGEVAGYLFEGDVEAGRKNWDAAAVAYRNGLQHVKHADLATRLHLALGKAGKTVEAERFLVTYEKEQPKDLGFVFYLGDIASQRGDFATAEARYRTVLAARPDDSLALNNLAYVLLKQSKPGALPLAEKANKLVPNQPAMMDTLAMALLADNQVPRALEVQKKAVALQPDYYFLRLNLAKIHIKAGDGASARTELEKLAKLGNKFAGQPEVASLLRTL